jgi:K+-sensing histidine kinase KdpD
MNKPQQLHTNSTIANQMDDLRLNLSLALPHELRTPLNVILGFSEYLVSQGPERLPDAEKLFQIQTSIYDNALRLHRLVENYLLYVRLTLTEHDSDHQSSDIWKAHEWIDSRSLLVSIARSLAQKYHRQKDMQLQLSETDLCISSRGLCKIVEELLDNALKFSAPGTPLLISTASSSGEWTLTIVDEGRGMTTEQIANIGAFMQFERLYYEQQGIGLGLTLATLLVHLNDGDLHIESGPEKGTTITVTFHCEEYS